MARFVSLLALAFGSPLTAAEKPNVLFVLADDQRFDTIALLGNAEIKTPHLDKLVRRGFSFTNAYCQGSMIPAVCTPSRTMILTGKSLFRIPNPQAKTYDGPTLPSTFGAARVSNAARRQARQLVPARARAVRQERRDRTPERPHRAKVRRRRHRLREGA